MPDLFTARGNRVYTIPLGQPFLPTLARAILSGDLPVRGGTPPTPLDLAGYTLLLPTRRASRAVADAFLTAAGGAALLLPRIRPIAEGQDEAGLLASLVERHSGAEAAEIPEAVDLIERRVVLLNLVMAWVGALAKGGEGDMATVPGTIGNTPAKAARLADDLARLMDMLEREGVSLGQLGGLVAADFAEQWQKTIDFLTIAAEFWPAYLSGQGLISPQTRQNLILEAQARNLAARPPKHPVIIAGVTGSIPATRALISAVANLENGAIVLPALDLALDEESWRAITPKHPEHPQFGLKKLLDELGLRRTDVSVLGAAAPSDARAGRAAFIAETMRPSSTTARWHEFARRASRSEVKAALQGVELIEAPSTQDEAEAISLILRRVAEEPGRTAALVSPDRLLARRVAVRLLSWGIRVDDSAGRPFRKTVPGTFFDLLIEAAAGGFSPGDLMALLRHPLARLGLDPFHIRRSARALEIAAFRMPYFGRGLAGALEALERTERLMTEREFLHPALTRLWPEDRVAARDLIIRLEAATKPLADAFTLNLSLPLQELVARHAAAAEAVSAMPAAAGEPAATELWSGDAGEDAALLFGKLGDPALPAPVIRAADYPDLYRSLVARETVRSRVPVHPRLSIWGPYEARLQQPDVVILGSLNEGTWPEAADPGPWLSRPMRAKLGLPSPEEELGRSAHDFVSLTGADQVYLTRAAKVDGVPTVPSRWLMRLSALLNGLDLDDALKPSEPWVGWALSRDAIGERTTVAAPAPRPPVALRPRRVSVSDVETWIANPYAIFAKHILKLRPLPELGRQPDASLRGSLIHDALARFAQVYPEQLPGDPHAAFLEVARSVLSEYTRHPRVAAFWLPRLERFAAWFAETEPARRSGGSRVAAEASGQLSIPAPSGAFILTARADRIDVRPSGIIITDYKTGAPPSDARVISGAAPQLPLEAAMADQFPNVPRVPVEALRYIRASGGLPPGVERTIGCADVAELAASVLAGATRLIAQFDDPATPYAAIRRAGFQYDYDDYALLARVAEWSGPTGDDEETADGP